MALPGRFVSAERLDPSDRHGGVPIVGRTTWLTGLYAVSGDHQSALGYAGGVAARKSMALVGMGAAMMANGR
jgi:hypothetical protein